MSSPLTPLLLQRIRDNGPLTVAEFVEAALYHETLGYYARRGQRSGREGDFFTSVDLGPLFGELLASQFAEMWEALRTSPRDDGHNRLSPPVADCARSADAPRFDLVEAGAGNGRLARDVLDAAERHHPEFSRAVRLHLAERSPQARAAQAAVLGAHAGALASSTSDLPEAVTGVIYANELLDALPPHLVVMRGEGLREVFVDADGDRLVTREGPPSSPRLAEYLRTAGARLEPGWFAEVNLAAADWIRRAGQRLQRGYLVIIDYGHDAATLYSPSHATGTLTTYRGHAAERREDGPGWLLEPGDRDITSHVDLTGIAAAGRDAGLRLLGVVDQAYFLLGLGLAGHLADDDSGSPRALARRLALKTLVMPGGLGSTLKVMVFAKSVDVPPLRGLSFGGRVT
jgi:SAM-dependent MidA family methyltransferase